MLILKLTTEYVALIIFNLKLQFFVSFSILYHPCCMWCSLVTVLCWPSVTRHCVTIMAQTFHKMIKPARIWISSDKLLPDNALQMPAHHFSLTLTLLQYSFIALIEPIDHTSHRHLGIDSCRTSNTAIILDLDALIQNIINFTLVIIIQTHYCHFNSIY